MEKVLQELQQTLEMGRKVISEYVIKDKNISDRENKVSVREKILEDKERNFSEREEYVSKVENAQKLFKDAQELLDSANSRVLSAIESEKKLKETATAELAKIQDSRTMLQRESEAVQKRSKQIDEEVQHRVDEFLRTGGWKK